MIGAQSDSIGTDARGSEPMAGDEYESPMTQASVEVKSVFDSITDAYICGLRGGVCLPILGGHDLLRI